MSSWTRWRRWRPASPRGQWPSTGRGSSTSSTMSTRRRRSGLKARRGCHALRAWRPMVGSSPSPVRRRSVGQARWSSIWRDICCCRVTEGSGALTTREVSPAPWGHLDKELCKWMTRGDCISGRVTRSSTAMPTARSSTSPDRSGTTGGPCVRRRWKGSGRRSARAGTLSPMAGRRPRLSSTLCRPWFSTRTGPCTWPTTTSTASIGSVPTVSSRR